MNPNPKLNTNPQNWTQVSPINNMQTQFLKAKRDTNLLCRESLFRFSFSLDLIPSFVLRRCEDEGPDARRASFAAALRFPENQSPSSNFPFLFYNVRVRNCFRLD